jgi:hypothetical protein
VHGGTTEEEGKGCRKEGKKGRGAEGQRGRKARELREAIEASVKHRDKGAEGQRGRSAPILADHEQEVFRFQLRGYIRLWVHRGVQLLAQFHLIEGFVGLEGW